MTTETLRGNLPFQFGDLIRLWFSENARDLPWRRERTPYRVWIAEVMLQQTVVPAVAKRFDQWMKLFPTVEALSEAAESEVLAAWEGLGYYSRARNLHKTAQIITQKYGGAFPNDRESLEALSGIGSYTTAAILSMAFDQPVPALDVNVRRVMSRFFGETRTDREVTGFLTEVAIASSPTAAGEALMELGQLICTGRNPNCNNCPFINFCKTRGELASEVERRDKRKTINRRDEIVVVALQAGSILIKPAGKEGLFAGLNLLPTLSTIDLADIEKRVTDYIGEMNVLRIERLKPVMHYFTTNAVRLNPVLVYVKNLQQSSDGFKWAALSTLSTMAFPSAHRKILEQAKVKCDLF